MHGDGLMFQAFIFLLATVVSVPIAKRLGLGSVLGYLIAGVVIGPYVLGLVGHDVESIMHFSEFGVVMMLFLIGLELRPELLWRLCGPILGLGGMQVALTTVAVFAIGLFGFDLVWQHALAIGLTLSLSSTAIVLQTLKEKGLMPTEVGVGRFRCCCFRISRLFPCWRCCLCWRSAQAKWLSIMMRPITLV